jgi:hypothetical protein
VRCAWKVEHSRKVAQLPRSGGPAWAIALARPFLSIAPRALTHHEVRGASYDSSRVSARGGLDMPGRLIVHAGAHKTGTTTTQLFLHYYHVWIRDTFDIHIVPNGKWTNHCASAECDDVLAVAGLLRQNHTVLISSELFGATTEPNQTFWSLHQLFAPLAELTVVMVHRHTMDWLASMYARPCRPAPVGSPP